MGVATRLARARELDALALASLLWFLWKFVRYAFPPLFPTFRATYGASNATLGLLFSGLMVAYAGMQFPSGALADRLGRVRVITAGAAVTAVAALLPSASGAFPVLAAAMVLIGLGTGAYKTVAIDLLAAVYPARTGRTLGVMDAAGELAGVAAPAAVVAALAAPAGWPAVFLGAGLAAAILGAAFHRVVPGRLEGLPSPDTTGGGRAYLAAVLRPRLAAFGLAVAAVSFAWNGVTAFLPLYLVSAAGLDARAAGLAFAGLFAVSLVQPVTGAIADRVGRPPVMIAALCLAASALAALVLSPGAPAAFVLVPLLGLGGHGFRPVRDAHLVGLVPEGIGGGTIGVVRTAMMAAGAASPAVVGALSEVAGFPAAFGLLVGALGLALALVAALALAG
ncbi:MAG: MFS transporter [Halobacteriales archaeon]